MKYIKLLEKLSLGIGVNAFFKPLGAINWLSGLRTSTPAPITLEVPRVWVREAGGPLCLRLAQLSLTQGREFLKGRVSARTPDMSTHPAATAAVAFHIWFWLPAF